MNTFDEPVKKLPRTSFAIDDALDRERERGQTLHFVDDDRCAVGRFDEAGQLAEGIGFQRRANRVVVERDEPPLGEQVTNEGGLARLARADQVDDAGGCQGLEQQGLEVPGQERRHRHGGSFMPRSEMRNCTVESAFSVQ